MFLNSRFATSLSSSAISFSNNSSSDSSFSSSPSAISEVSSLYFLSRLFQTVIHSLRFDISWRIFWAEILSFQKSGSLVFDCSLFTVSCFESISKKPPQSVYPAFNIL